MERKSKNLKQKWIPGAIVEIDLMDGTYTYAQVLEDPLVAFFDILRKDIEPRPSLQDITKTTMLFRLSLYDEAIKRDWLRIGNDSYDPKWDIYPERYVIDADTGEITIWKSQGEKIPGTREDIENMERFAVWEPGAVEQRLRDYFAGRPCWYIEADKPGWKPISAKAFYAKYGYDFHWLDDEDKKV